MPYTPQTWTNGVSKLNATRMTVIENGIAAAVPKDGAADEVAVGTGAGTIAWQKIGNAQVATNAAIAQSKIAFDAWTSYTPALTAATTSPTLGAGSSSRGRYLRIGNLVIVNVTIVFGSSGVSAGSGAYFISLPVNAETISPLFRIGRGFVYDSNTGNSLAAIRVETSDTTKVALYYSATYLGTDTAIGSATPWTWAASDQISMSAIYEAA